MEWVVHKTVTGGLVFSQNGVEKLVKAIEKNSKAPNTQSAYWSDISQFEKATGVHTYPVPGQLLKFYFSKLATEGYKWASLSRKLTSLDFAHKEIGEELPDLTKFMKGLKRTMPGKLSRICALQTIPSH